MVTGLGSCGARLTVTTGFLMLVIWVIDVRRRRNNEAMWFLMWSRQQQLKCVWYGRQHHILHAMSVCKVMLLFAYMWVFTYMLRCLSVCVCKTLPHKKYHINGTASVRLPHYRYHSSSISDAYLLRFKAFKGYASVSYLYWSMSLHLTCIHVINCIKTSTQ